jgi:hypothetical protein
MEPEWVAIVGVCHAQTKYALNADGGLAVAVLAFNYLA